MDLFSKTFKDDLEEREEAEVFRRDGGPDGGADHGQDHSSRGSAVGWGRGGREGLALWEIA